MTERHSSNQSKTNEPGVTITLTQIYETTEKLADGVQRLESRFERLDEKLSLASEADARSKEALSEAKDAARIANDAYKKVDSNEKSNKNLRTKILGSVITAVVPYVFGFIGLVIYLINQGGF